MCCFSIFWRALIKTIHNFFSWKKFIFKAINCFSSFYSVSHINDSNNICQIWHWKVFYFRPIWHNVCFLWLSSLQISFCTHNWVHVIVLSTWFWNPQCLQSDLPIALTTICIHMVHTGFNMILFNKSSFLSDIREFITSK